MLIIVEGPDGAGKTTFAERWLTAHGGEIIHMGPPVRHPLEEYELTLDTYFPGETNIIADRWHLGERVYPVIHGRETFYSPAVHRHVEMFLCSRGAVVYPLSAAPSVLRRRITRRGTDTSPSSGELIAAISLFDAAFEATMLRKEWYANLLMTAATIEEYRARALLTITKDVISEPNPTVLYVGDERSASSQHARHSVPFIPYEGTCGEWLFQALPATACAITNARVADAQNGEHLLQLFQFYSGPDVVALGRAAHHELMRLGIPHGQAPHPEYARRFHHGDLERYRDALKIAGHGGDASRRLG